LIDLNHSSGAKIAPLTLCDEINAIIDAGILRRREAEKKRTYLGASMLGDPCGRKLCYDFGGYPIDAGRELTARTVRIFDIGHGMEDAMAEAIDSEQDKVFKNAAAQWFADGGFQLLTKNSKGEQFGWEALDGQVQGHIDGCLVAGPAFKIPLPYPSLWEAKALNKKSWSKIKKYGLKVGSELYFNQCQINMGYLGVFTTLFTAVNKDTEELNHELIEYDDGRAQQLSDRAVNVIHHVKQGQLLPRAFNNADFFLCKFCNWRKRCWELSQ
jgi:hypothetical protein